MTDTRITEVTVRVSTLLKIVAVGFLVAVLVFLREIFALLIVAVVLAIIVSPVADLCERYRIPRALGIFSVYLIAFGVFGVLFALLAQPLLAEARGLVTALPDAWNRIVTATASLRAFSLEHGLTDQIRGAMASMESRIAAGVFGVLSDIFGGVLSLVLVLVLAFYLAAYATTIRRSLIAMASERWQPFLIGVVPRIERKMGAWLRGLLALGAIIGFSAFLGLSILRVEYALLLGLLAGVLEVIPFAGPIVATVVAVLIAFLQSPAKALLVLIFFVVLQQIENHLLVPKIMQRAVGVHPVVSMLALLAGAKIGGVPGILLAVPIVASIMVFIEEYGREHRTRAAAMETKPAT
ncbi:AI-2E family transporter [Candidatus Uhrbacteria bacterium]|nr:AI-2E family transporter [Candidatus Uhrbacteria bacterium]